MKYPFHFLSMKFISIPLFILFFFPTPCCSGQISTDRPGFANGTTIVPTGMLQLESGYQFSRLPQHKEHALGQLLLRTAPLERLEFRLGLNSYIATRDQVKNQSGFEDWSLGLKLKLAQGADTPGIKSLNVSAIVETTLPTGSKAYSANKLQPFVMLVLDWALPGNLAISPFMSYTLVSSQSSQFNEFGGGVSLSVALSGRSGFFLEYYGVAAQSDYGADISYLDGGLTYLITDNCQLDLHSGQALSGKTPDYFMGIGFSYRFAMKK